LRLRIGKTRKTSRIFRIEPLAVRVAQNRPDEETRPGSKRVVNDAGVVVTDTNDEGSRTVQTVSPAEESRESQPTASEAPARPALPIPDAFAGVRCPACRSSRVRESRRASRDAAIVLRCRNCRVRFTPAGVIMQHTGGLDGTLSTWKRDLGRVTPLILAIVIAVVLYLVRSGAIESAPQPKNIPIVDQ
jgi:hypothetical protein